eukprot:TRINITY_DN2851_c0_g2_i2.p1 TRINITY_DN2851_c0_g2~~TRINITY_DN2851_c0_g2_i2.p1  ORF type:complete len:361 (-),score=95.87 TRINITY_DN2851_c0_g2_i2:103-1158(-)
MATDGVVRAFAAVGVAATVAVAAKCAWVLYNRFLRRRVSWAQYRGEWAVVTGASQGIGRAFAVSCARRGMNVVAIARREDELQRLAAEIRGECASVDVLPFVADLSHDEEHMAQVYSRLAEATEGRVVSLLVNNLGGALGAMRRDPSQSLWITTSVEEERASRRLNVDHVLALTRLFLPQMRERGRGAVINVSSTSAFGSPYFTNYGSDKAKIDAFSRSIGTEMRPYGVTVQAIHIVEVATDQTSNPATSLFVRSPDDLAEAALDNFGRGGYVSVPLWQHAIMDTLLYSAPECIATRVLERHIACVLREVAQKENAKAVATTATATATTSNERRQAVAAPFPMSKRRRCES